jgi:hypothetical protein
VSLNRAILADLVTFAHLERDAADIEPWAALIGHAYDAGHLDAERAAWLIKLYNATDDLGTAAAFYTAAPGPQAWRGLPVDDADALSRLPISQERRNLRGGRITRHLDSYAETLDGWTQAAWLRAATPPETAPADGFYPLMAAMRTVWGTGRQSAFEWAEFVGKVGLVKVEAPDACLWESSGPRDSLEELFGRPAADQAELDQWAHITRDALAEHGVHLPWWDLETVICDFKVMRRGRYYPGRHLGMLRAELDAIHGPLREPLEEAWHAVIPAPWAWIPAGDRADLRPLYRDRGTIVTPFGAAS